ncbi:unnamed protein product [Rotaria sp. Silwood1]|nr:unnamed protein product [Rotaria sp. Silwood1]CAF3720225.1 unnamed protein product [Rotaria sp. Silwood1]CAF4666131.1 unnamed protein product [Rotaria sp. Silwood1]CAF4820979.1 unnamed protein product [Rotaria sp. Silwood1]
MFLFSEFERETSELRRQCKEERLTKEELQRKYNDLKGQYDNEIDALTYNKNNGGDQQLQTINNDRNKTKKKTNSNKQKHNEQILINDQYENDDNISISLNQMDSQEKLQRLQELEKKLIGGEEINNEERKKKRKKKLNEMREKQEQRKRFTRAIDTNDDDMMMRVFDNAQEELHFTSKKLEQVHTENKRLKNDNEDLQHEFERDRRGYLNTIRTQEKQLLLFRVILEKMSSTMQRNCNYTNIDKIIEQARYDEEKNEYIVPDPIKEEVQFPHVGNLPITTTNGRILQNDFITSSKSLLPPPSTDYDYDYIIPSQTNNIYHNQISNMNSEELERRYGRNIDTTNISFGKIRNKRQEQLLNQNALLQSTKIHPLQMKNTDNDYMNRRLNPFDAPTRLTRKYGFSTDKQ